VWVFPRETSLADYWALVAHVVAPVVPAAGPYAPVANARLAVDSKTVGHSGSALADYSVGLRADDSARAVVLAALQAVGSVPAYLAGADLVVLTAHHSTPADCLAQADPSEQRCPLDARPVW